ncbi:MAG TPA: hypothetical protein ENF73_05915, partial [Proteobacteria bacterium]|nr:hypothetical protein [Pseudomonadota bacterium]
MRKWRFGEKIMVFSETDVLDTLSRATGMSFESVLMETKDPLKTPLFDGLGNLRVDSFVNFCERHINTFALETPRQAVDDEDIACSTRAEDIRYNLWD